MITSLCFIIGAPTAQSKVADSRLVAPETSAASSVTLNRALALSAWTTGLRRDLHKCPELLYDLDKTAAYVRSVLDELKIPYQYPIATNGIVATIGSGASPSWLRADMDALPILEEIRGPFRSETEGKMHACGHDAHTAMLLTAARILKEREQSLAGTVKLIFQPAEEGGAGGLAMIKAGLLEQMPKIERVFALHVWPGQPAGTIATMPGTIMAAAGFFHARMLGHGGHAAMPHTTTDPFSCVAAALSGLQTVVARNVAYGSGRGKHHLCAWWQRLQHYPRRSGAGWHHTLANAPRLPIIDESVQRVLRGAAELGGCG